ncbi:hypothetical protein PRZ48_000055 [Zasmidium cellare]|uniref:Uncharacterized protein n=1 Tax=Zasmidium cellare TaxID=395010 RepID=A0ABR0EZ32_ZASCE|nr:hypothetical protein PRZ48_000055 [Zasmidium cellare]
MGSLKPTYISIPESRGLTHTLTPTNPNIGTSDLITCVGVYLPISATRCFVAHINAYFDKPEAKSEFEKRWTTTEQGAQIREEVLRRLREHSQREGWSARDVVESGRKVVVMCPCYKDGKQGLRLSGVFVVEAIREFVGGVPVEEYFDNGLQKGFVLNVFVLSVCHEGGADESVL